MKAHFHALPTPGDDIQYMVHILIVHCYDLQAFMPLELQCLHIREKKLSKGKNH